ncbi:MAG: hypothetical protein GYB49_15805 [Alphaproteobacteria bacterium]|nr:hypothetical protein [Hyphomonas sp.]MBR9808680.1 hypothetical protein [Alphaproteobacteria bacterium]
MTNKFILQGQEASDSILTMGERGREYRPIAQNPFCGDSDELRRQLNLLCALDNDWDGYGSPPVKFENAELALRIVTNLLALFENSRPPIQALNPGVPYFVPVSGGALQIEWHLPNSKFVELFVDGSDRCLASFVDEVLDEDREISIDCSGPQIDLNELSKWIVEAMRSEGQRTVAA